MADDDKKKPPKKPPNKSPKKPYKEGNTAPDGSYQVGRGKTPEATRFRADDGRKRGRRPKGTRNLATDFNEEMGARVTLKVDGKPRRVTRQRSIIMRLVDNASRGNNTAIQTVLAYRDRYAASEPNKSEVLEHGDEVTSFDFSEFSNDEINHFAMMMDKAAGRPMGKWDEEQWQRSPENPKNYTDTRSVEGVRVREYRRAVTPDELLALENRAYHSAVLPRTPGCCRILF